MYKKVLKTLFRGALGLLAAAAISSPAHAEFIDAAPQVYFSGVVQGVSGQSVAIQTPTGTVLVPANQSIFVANGVTTSPYSLPAGTPVVVTVPQFMQPEMALASLAPPPVPLYAFPTSFGTYLVDNTVPLEPLPPAPVYGVPAAPVAYLPPAPGYSYVAPPVSYASYGFAPIVSPVAVAPPPPYTAVPGYYSGYNAFGTPMWAQAAASTVSLNLGGNARLSFSSYSAAPPYGYGAFGMAPVPMTYFQPPAVSTGIGLNLGGVQVGYNTYQPMYGYGPGFVPPAVAVVNPYYSPYPYSPYAAFTPAYQPMPYGYTPYGGYGALPGYGVSSTSISLGNGMGVSFNNVSPGYGMMPYGYGAFPGYGVSSTSISLGNGLGISFNNVSPSYGMPYAPYPMYGYAAMPYGYPAAPYGYPMAPYGASTVNLSLGNGINLGFNSFSPQPMMYPMGGFIAPTNVTTVSFGGLAFNIVNAAPMQPTYFAPINYMPAYAPVAPFGYPALGPAVGFAPNALIVQTPGGLLSMPVSAMPAPVMNQMVFIQPPNGVITQVPLQTALVLRQQGATILTNPVIPSTALLGRVAVMRPSGHVVNVPMVAALHAHNGLILGPAGAVPQAGRLNPAVLREQRSFGFISPTQAARVGAPVSGQAAFAHPGHAVNPQFHPALQMPAGHGPVSPHFAGHVNPAAAPHGGVFNPAQPAFHGGAQPAFHGGAHAAAQPAFHGGAHAAAQPAFHGGAHAAAQPAFHGGAHAAAQPAFHGGAHPAAQPHFNAPRPQPHFNAPHAQPHFNAPRPQPHFNAPRPQPHFAPAPQPHFNAPRPQPHFAPAPQPHFNAPRPQPHFAPAPQPHFNAAPRGPAPMAPRGPAPAPRGGGGNPHQR